MCFAAKAVIMQSQSTSVIIIVCIDCISKIKLTSGILETSIFQKLEYNFACFLNIAEFKYSCFFLFVCLILRKKRKKSVNLKIIKNFFLSCNLFFQNNSKKNGEKALLTYLQVTYFKIKGQ